MNGVVMLSLDKRTSVDLLIEQFWKQGYLTLSRKFGTYLPEPSRVGMFDVDVIARQKKNYAIGITLTEEDFKNPALPEKIIYLASRHTKFSNKKVMLFVGVPENRLKMAKALLEAVEPAVKRNIKLFPIVARTINTSERAADKSALFS
jgi:hypothetical protein